MSWARPFRTSCDDEPPPPARATDPEPPYDVEGRGTKLGRRSPSQTPFTPAPVACARGRGRTTRSGERMTVLGEGKRCRRRGTMWNLHPPDTVDSNSTSVAVPPAGSSCPQARSKGHQESTQPEY